MALVGLQDDPTYQPPPQQAPQAAAPAAPRPGTAEVQNYYQTYLGRAAMPEDPERWLTGAYGYGTDLPTIENAIRNAPEAQAYRARSGGTAAAAPAPAPAAAGGDYQSWFNSLIAGRPFNQQTLLELEPTLNAAGLQLTPPNANGERTKIRLPDGTWVRVGFGEGHPVWVPQGGGGGGAEASAAPAYGGTNIFSDPATAQFEQLLNSLIGRFNTAQTPPHYQQTIDQLNAYLAQLNGPVYTPAQMELMQTQAWDPMQQQHDAARQQLMQRLGSRGISPSSGIFESALADLDRQFQQAHTTTQANFSNQAIGLHRQNQATAATLAPQISALEQAQTSWQDQRALQGEVLAALIPQMARQRVLDASGSVSPINPASLFQQQQNFQQQGYNQSANYSSQIAQLLAALFGMAG